MVKDWNKQFVKCAKKHNWQGMVFAIVKINDDKCEICGAEVEVDQKGGCVHHKGHFDSWVQHNSVDNIQVVCPKCHRKIHQ